MIGWILFAFLFGWVLGLGTLYSSLDKTYGKDWRVKLTAWLKREENERKFFNSKGESK